LVLAGGVALNCVANGKLLKSNIFDNIFIQPAAGDAGGSLGAALATHYIYYENERITTEKDMMKGSYLGPECSDLEIELMARKYKATFEKFDAFEELAEKTAALICNANVIGWHQDRMEFGPRALGNRSILGDPTNTEMQRKINLKIKYRESFRPFAPSVLAEDSSKYFDLEDKDSPYMLLVADVNQNYCKPVPENYYEMPLRERLYVLRSDIQSITHIDFSARVQSVHEDTNPKYYTLLQKMKAKNGVGMVINTSFNVRGEPIVCTPEDSYRCFMRTEMDYLVINNYLFKKTAQPEWDKKDNWQEEFVLD
jgi:carbamoyltransferase